MTETTTTTAVIYLRVSTDKQLNKGTSAEGFSLPAQRDACTKEAAKLGATIGAEFVDAGESARSADRPELAKMLTWIAEHKPDYVIVHKIDRLARNRADDVAINLEIRKAGASLVSCSENIDETPSGLLMHGMLSAFAEFYSANLAAEVKKGSLQKAKDGGTVGKAPLGYLNVRQTLGGREIRTIDIDEERAPFIRQAFERYADGDISIRDLLDDLTDQGLTTRPGPKTPAKQLSKTRFHRLLRSPYYKGLVIYQGATYPGNHQALITEDTWDKVQRRLDARNTAGERKQRHHHYLKGTVYCASCGSRLIIVKPTNRHGTTYEYFTCIGRWEKLTDCQQKAIAISTVETLVEDHYAAIQPKPDFLDALEAMLTDELETQAAVMDKQHAAQTRRVERLLDERQKLLQAHYADAIPLDQLRTEQTRIATELTKAEELIEATNTRHDLVRRNLRNALNEAHRWHDAYQRANPDVRREINQAVFNAIYVGHNHPTTSQLAEPFHTLLSTETTAVTIDHAQQDGQKPDWLDEQLQALWNEYQTKMAADANSDRCHRHDPCNYKTPPSKGQGLSLCTLVPGAGLEPARRFPSRGV